MGEYECGHRIDGPTVMDGRTRRPISRRHCKRKVATPHDKCWQHGGPVAKGGAR